MSLVDSLKLRILSTFFVSTMQFVVAATDLDRIQPYPGNPWYWQYQGKPVFLVGGSDDDNPFQWTPKTLTSHLEVLESVGGNYIRNVMSSRDAGNVHPFPIDDGRCDLRNWNDEYWQRLDRFLQETSRRSIVVQLTLWDQHDFTGDKWASHFWNPNHNLIGVVESRLHDAHSFFKTVDENNALVLPYQIKFVDKILSVSLKYDHVLYNINNEGWAGPKWETFWAKRVREVAALRGKEVELTTMQHGPNISVDAVVQDPDTFDFVELSQNNGSSLGGKGMRHWVKIQDWRRTIDETTGPRPMNNIKIYGGPRGPGIKMGGDAAAIHRLWSNTLSGCASVRFHRPEWGMGLGEDAQKWIKAVRWFSDNLDITHSKPSPELLKDGARVEALCLQSDARDIGLYLPTGGDVTLRVKNGSYSILQLSFDSVSWSDATSVDTTKGELRVTTRDGQPAVVLIKKSPTDR